MLKFFGHLRQKLLSENKFSKYLLYAVGEIVLVVIGILIALQINNWNEAKNNKKEEKLLLVQLKSDLDKNRAEVEDIKDRLLINKDAIDSLLYRFKTKNYDLMVPIYVAFSQRKNYFNNANSGHQMLQNGMANLISKDSILKGILNLYENDFEDIAERQKMMHSKIDLIQQNFINKLFKPATNVLSVKLNDYDLVSTDLFAPVDFKALVQNTEYTNNLIQLKKSVDTRLAFIEKTSENLDRTLQLLNEELNTNSND